MAWCKASSITAAVARSLRDLSYPASKTRIISLVRDLKVEGWDVEYFLGEALTRRSYPGLREIMSDLESWLEVQG